MDTQGVVVSGGRGIVTDDPHRVRGELSLVAQAARNGWAVTPEMKSEAPAIAMEMAKNAIDPRAKAAALRALATFDQINQVDHWNNDKNDRMDAGKPTEIAGVVIAVPGMVSIVAPGSCGEHVLDAKSDPTALSGKKQG